MSFLWAVEQPPQDSALISRGFHMAGTCWPIFPPPEYSPSSDRGSALFPLNLPDIIWKMWRQAERTKQTRGENCKKKKVSPRSPGGGSRAGQRSKQPAERRRLAGIDMLSNRRAYNYTAEESINVRHMWLETRLRMAVFSLVSELIRPDISSPSTHIPWKHTWSLMCSCDLPVLVVSRRLKTFWHLVGSLLLVLGFSSNASGPAVGKRRRSSWVCKFELIVPKWKTRPRARVEKVQRKITRARTHLSKPRLSLRAVR